MARFPVSPYWSSNPNIPIYLEGTDDQQSSQETPDDTSRERPRAGTPDSRHQPEYCPACNTNSRDTPIHCVSVSPSPPAYSSISPRVPSYRQHLAVPALTVETPSRWSRPQTPSRTLQIDPEGRPNIRFRRNAFSPLSPTNTHIDELEWHRKSAIGLGIPDVPYQPDNSPLTPGAVEKRGEERREGTNLAERIEERLWNYQNSGNVMKKWLIEIVSWLLSAACMSGIIVMLLVYKQKRIPTWPLGLTLNAYISVLAKVASAALLLPVSEALGQLKWSWFQEDKSKKMWDFELFDSASRGPWGSFLLLIRTKGKNLAALGALVTLFALALDPFFQQVVEYPEVLRLQSGQGTIPRATGYEPFAQASEYQNFQANMDVDKTMLGVLSRFFYDNGTTPMQFGKGIRAEIPMSCPFNNCTWPAYETLGVHSECVDASDRLEFACRYDKLDWVEIPTPGTESGLDVTYPNGTACGWWLKADNPLLMTGYNTVKTGEHGGETLLGRLQPYYDLFSRDPIPGYEPKLNVSRNPLMQAVIVSGRDHELIHQNATPIAHECVISWAVLTIESHYIEGSYEENVTSAFVNNTGPVTPWITETIEGLVNELTTYSYFYPENITIDGANGTKYNIENTTYVLTVGAFDDLFPSEYVLINSTDESAAMLRYKQYNTINPYTRNVTYNPWMYNNVSVHMDRMSVAITNLMRSATNDVELVYGQAWDKESVVEVRWWWLSLPLGLLILTGIFLLSTVVRSEKEINKVGIWKTSAIAPLFHGLPSHVSDKIASKKDHGTPRAQAKEMKVKWIPNKGWRLSGNSVSPTSIRNIFTPSLRPESPKPESPDDAKKARPSPPITSRNNWI